MGSSARKHLLSEMSVLHQIEYNWYQKHDLAVQNEPYCFESAAHTFFQLGIMAGCMDLTLHAWRALDWDAALLMGLVEQDQKAAGPILRCAFGNPDILNDVVNDFIHFGKWPVWAGRLLGEAVSNQWDDDKLLALARRMFAHVEPNASLTNGAQGLFREHFLAVLMQTIEQRGLLDRVDFDQHLAASVLMLAPWRDQVKLRQSVQGLGAIGKPRKI